MYESDSKHRNAEMELALEINASVFDEITVIAQSMPRPAQFRGNWISITNRQRGNDLLDAAKMSSPGDIVVISNGDIFHSKYGLTLMDANITYEDAYCLSRWDFTPHGVRLFDRIDSQDSWVFRGSPRLPSAPYAMGVPGVDNRLAHDLQACGYNVSNPSRDIRTYHLHLSAHRPSNMSGLRIDPPYLHIKPSRLGEPPSLSVPKIPSKGPSAF